MKTDKEMAEALYRNYKESLRKEEDLWNRSQKHFEKWEQSECENEGAYEEYERIHDQYIEAKKETDMMARLVLEYAFKE